MKEGERGCRKQRRGSDHKGYRERGEKQQESWKKEKMMEKRRYWQHRRNDDLKR